MYSHMHSMYKLFLQGVRSMSVILRSPSNLHAMATFSIKAPSPFATPVGFLILRAEGINRLPHAANIWGLLVKIACLIYIVNPACAI